MQAVILGAGKGTRLHPITLKRSKAMAPIAGRPMAARVMDLFIQQDIRDFILVVSPQDQEIRSYFETEVGLDVMIRFVVQEERLGMAHALSLAAPYLGETFILSACDNLVPGEHVAELIARHQMEQARATLSLMEIEPAAASRTAVVDWGAGEIRRIVEKPGPDEVISTIASLPLYIFSPQLLTYLPQVKRSARGEYELQEAIQLLIEQEGGVTGVLTPRRLQLTNADDLLKLNRHYLTVEGKQLQVRPDQIGPQSCLAAPVRIEAGTIIGAGCVIGPRVYIERDCRIGANVLIRDALILRNTIVEEGRQVMGEVVG